MQTSNSQERYNRGSDNPLYDGMRRGDAAVMSKTALPDFPGKVSALNISRSASDVGVRGSRATFLDVHENVTHSPQESPSDIILEPLGRTSSGRWSKKDSSSSILGSNPLGSSNELENKSKSTKEPGQGIAETNEERERPGIVSTRPITERSFSMTRRGASLSKIPLPPSAESFYNGSSPQMEIVESCESINRLNLYLKAARDEVSAGVPGKLLRAVLGQDVSDVASVASTILYAFYLNEVLKNNQFCTVPVINMKRADLYSQAELKWLLDSCSVDQSSLLFIDEIDLSYFDLYGSLKLVLLNGDKLPAKQEALKEALVEIFNCRKGDSLVGNITVRQDCSCCTLVAENFAMTSPEILAGKGFSRLLLAGILMDTGNLTNPTCTSKDKYMTTLLINGAGRFGCNGLYQILRYKMNDASELKVGEILRKDFKKWTRIGKSDTADSRLIVSHIGMSSIGMPIVQLLALNDTSTPEIIHFQKMEKLRLLMIVSGYYDSQKNFKRELLVSAESTELIKSLLQFFETNAPNLPLKVLNQPGLRDEMEVFEIDKVTSRKRIERLLEEFGGISKNR